MFSRLLKTFILSIFLQGQPCRVHTSSAYVIRKRLVTLPSYELLYLQKLVTKWRFLPSENLHVEKFSPCATMVGLIVDSGYERLSSTLSANSIYKISKMALFFAKPKLKIAFSSQLRTSILKMLFRDQPWWAI